MGQVFLPLISGGHGWKAGGQPFSLSLGGNGPLVLTNWTIELMFHLWHGS